MQDVQLLRKPEHVRQGEEHERQDPLMTKREESKQVVQKFEETQ